MTIFVNFLEKNVKFLAFFYIQMAIFQMVSSEDPSLKIRKKLILIYRLTCPRCSACYVEQTGRHTMLTRNKQNLHRVGLVKIKSPQPMQYKPHRYTAWRGRTLGDLLTVYTSES